MARDGCSRSRWPTIFIPTAQLLRERQWNITMNCCATRRPAARVTPRADAEDLTDPQALVA